MKARGGHDSAVKLGPDPDLKVITAELADPFNKNNRYARCYWLTAFRMESDRPLHMNLDGEPVVESRFEFKTHPRGLSVVLGRRAAKPGRAVP